MLEALRAPFEFDPITVQVDASISIALCPDHCEHPNDLLNGVETTMLMPRRAASKIVIDDAGRRGRRRTTTTTWWRNCARRCRTTSWTCYYEFKIRADDVRVHSVEALLCWTTRVAAAPSRGVPARG